MRAARGISAIKSDESGSRRLAAFGQLGVADARADRFARYIGTGIVMAAPWRGRDQDELGLAVAAARDSGQYNTAPPARDARVEATMDGIYGIRGLGRGAAPQIAGAQGGRGGVGIRNSFP